MIRAESETSARRAGLLGTGAIYTVANVASAAVPFLLLPILTRILSVQEYGVVSNFFLAVSASMAFAGLGLQGYVGVRWFDREKVDFPVLVSTILLMVAATTVIAALATPILLSVVGIDLGLDSAWISLAVVAAGCTTIANVRTVLWQSQVRPLAAAGFQFASSVVNGGLSLLGVLALGLGAFGRMGGGALALIAFAILAVWLLARDVGIAPRVTMDASRPAFRYVLPLLPSALAGTALLNGDRFIVADQLGVAAIGIYGAAAQLGTVINVLADAFVKAYNPWMFERLKRFEARDKLALVGMIYLSVPFFLALAACVLAVVYGLGPILLGSKFLSALPLLPWFFVGGAFIGMYHSVSGLFFFSSQTEMISLTTTVSAIVGIAVCFLLVKAYGINGAAAAYAFTQAFDFLFLFSLAVGLRRMPWGSPIAAVRVALAELR